MPVWNYSMKYFRFYDQNLILVQFGQARAWLWVKYAEYIERRVIVFVYNDNEHLVQI